MSKGWTFKSGDWNVNCDVCSKKTKASLTKLRWDGFQVCPDCFEERQPLDFVRARQDKINVPWSRPIPPLEFVDVPYICTVEGKSAVSGVAIAGCAIAGAVEGQTTYPNYNAIAGRAIAGIAIAGVSTYL